MPYVPEPALPSDLGPAIELLRRSELPDKGVAESFGHYRVVRDMGRLIGVCGLEVHGQDGLLRSLAVEPEQRGYGVGGLLVDEVLALARKIGLRDLYLLTTTAGDYFRKRGFADCERGEAPPGIRESWEYKSGCPASSAFMRLRLG